MSPIDYCTVVLKKYAVFTGRARRAEYWWFALFSTLISYALAFIGGYLLHIVWLGSVFSFVMLLPSIAVGIRRIHDVNKSGWFILIPLYNLILFVTPGTVGPNDYGPDPKGATDSFLTSEPEVY